MKQKEDIPYTGNLESEPKYRVEKDPFDSEVFGTDVVKVRFNSGCDNGKKVKEDIFETGERPMIVFGFTPIIQDNIDFFSEIGCKLTSINNTYKYDNERQIFSKKIPAGVSLFDLSNIPSLSQSSIDKLASILAKTSRLLKDPAIPKDKTNDFYRKWVKNSLFSGYPDQVFVLAKNDDLAGMCTLKIKGNTGNIDLIGVSDESQGMGLGNILLKNTIEYFKSKGINDIRVETQAENLPANIFYQKSGFLINNVDLVYHGHF